MKYLLILFTFIPFSFSTILNEPKVNKSYIQFQSYNVPTHYIRHYSGNCIISEQTNELSIWDATWIPVKGLANSSSDYVSYKSANYPNTYLRHQGGVIKISSNDGSELFKKDATWKVEKGIANKARISLRTFQWKGVYLRHKNGKLRIDRIKSEQDKMEATWVLNERPDLLSKIPVPTPALLIGENNGLCKIDFKKQWRHLYVELMADGKMRYKGQLRNTGITGYHSRIVTQFFTKNGTEIAKLYSKAYSVDGEDLDGHTEIKNINDLVPLDAKLFNDLKKDAHSITVSCFRDNKYGNNPGPLVRYWRKQKKDPIGNGNDPIDSKELTAKISYYSKTCDYDVYSNKKGSACSKMKFAGTIGKGKRSIQFEIKVDEELFVKIMEKGKDVCKGSNIVKTAHIKISPHSKMSTTKTEEVRSSSCD